MIQWIITPERRYGLLRGSKMKRFAFIEAMKKAYPIEQLCKVMQVSSRGYRDWRNRAPSQRSREDLVLSAHIRAQAKLCNFSYGRIRMTLELRDLVFCGRAARGTFNGA